MTKADLLAQADELVEEAARHPDYCDRVIILDHAEDLRRKAAALTEELSHD